ncbi:MAG: hypothetical protein AAF376_12175 [Pseudomonadota bacterium]
MRATLPALALALSLTGITAPNAAHAECMSSAQLISSIEFRIDRFARDVDVRQLSCNGVAQVFFLLERSGRQNRFTVRQQILAVFRREGLIS